MSKFDLRAFMWAIMTEALMFSGTQAPNKWGIVMTGVFMAVNVVGGTYAIYKGWEKS